MFEVIPAVDVLDGKVVRLLRGDYERVTEYGTDPVAACLEWMVQGARLVHVVDLEGARSGAADRGLWKRLADAGVVFEIGGGIRSAEDAKAAIDAGASYVVVGTAAVWAPETLGDAVSTGRVMAAVDVQDGKAKGQGWLDDGRPFSDVLDGLAGAGIGRVLVTGIGTDGTMSGPDLSLLAAAVSRGRFDVIASGGIGTLEDVAAVARLGCAGVVIGKALYERRFTVAEAMTAMS